jgi:endonuclease YncB( thermonuclease family)
VIAKLFIFLILSILTSPFVALFETSSSTSLLPLTLTTPKLITTNTPGWIGPSIGNQTVIATNVSRNFDNDNTDRFIVIIEARDSDGITLFLATKSGTLEKGDAGPQQVNTTWTIDLDHLTAFELRAFAISNLDQPHVLSYLYESWVDLSAQPGGGDSENRIQGEVTKIVDGDTLDIGNVRIRLALVNTPEIGEDGYQDAKSFTALLCPVGSSALADKDDGQPEGSYGRVVAKVTCGHKILNAELLKYGHASILKEFCSVSEFAADDWAWEACKSNGNLPKDDDEQRCDPYYPDVCIPSPPPDLDCGQVPFRNFRVLPPDPHLFDADKNGIGCEN